MKTLPESRIPVLEICDVDIGKPVIVKVNPGDNPYDRFVNTSMKLEDVIKRFEDLLTEEDIIKLKETINNERNTNK